MNKVASFLVGFALAAGASVSFAAPTAAPSYTPEQKGEIMKVAEISGFSFGATKSVLDACPTPSAQIVRYDTALKKYREKLGRYSFGVSAQKAYDSAFDKSKQELAAKLLAADKTALCKEIAMSLEEVLQKLEGAVKDGDTAMEPKLTPSKSKK